MNLSMTRAFVETCNFGGNGAAVGFAIHIDMYGCLDCVPKSMTRASVERGSLAVTAWPLFPPVILTCPALGVRLEIDDKRLERGTLAATAWPLYAPDIPTCTDAFIASVVDDS